MRDVDERSQLAYYRGALLSLQFAEQRKPTNRRFGSDADARWRSFCGDLTTADRIDLLIRDADAEWPRSLGPRTTFHLRAAAEDEPFGVNWVSLTSVDAEEIWRDVVAREPHATAAAILAEVARAWGLELQELEDMAVDAATKLVVCGPSAIARAIRSFHGQAELDWCDQVAVVATPPAHRQLAALAGLVLNIVGKPVSIIAANQPSSLAARSLFLSDDADPTDAAWAKSVVEG